MPLNEYAFTTLLTRVGAKGLAELISAKSGNTPFTEEDVHNITNQGIKIPIGTIDLLYEVAREQSLAHLQFYERPHIR